MPDTAAPVHLEQQSRLEGFAFQTASADSSHTDSNVLASTALGYQHQEGASVDSVSSDLTQRGSPQRFTQSSSQEVSEHQASSAHVQDSMNVTASSPDAAHPRAQQQQLDESLAQQQLHHATSGQIDISNNQSDLTGISGAVQHNSHHHQQQQQQQGNSLMYKQPQLVTNPADLPNSTALVSETTMQDSKQEQLDMLITLFKQGKLVLSDNLVWASASGSFDIEQAAPSNHLADSTRLIYAAWRLSRNTLQVPWRYVIVSRLTNLCAFDWLHTRTTSPLLFVSQCGCLI